MESITCEVHIHPLPDVTQVQENFFLFEKPRNWEVHEIQTMLYVLVFSMGKQGLNA